MSENLRNERHTSAEEIIQGMSNGPEIHLGAYQTPCYIPALDQVRMPELKVHRTAAGLIFDLLSVKFHKVVYENLVHYYFSKLKFYLRHARPVGQCSACGCAD